MCEEKDLDGFEAAGKKRGEKKGGKERWGML